MPVVLLVHCDGTNGSTTFTDASPSAHPLTAGGSGAVSTTSPKFGTGSLAASYVLVSGSLTDFNFGAGQFTLEAWVYFTSTPAGSQIVLGRFGGSTDLGWDFGMNAGTLALFYSTTGTDAPSVAGTYAPTLNTWIHLAVDRDAANALRVYANGAVIASATVAATFFASTRVVLIGNDENFTRAFPGRIDEVRVVKGAAMYGGAFTPPTAPFLPTIQNALATQVALEHWFATDPAAWVTQVAVEHWATVEEGPPPPEPGTDNVRVVIMA